MLEVDRLTVTVAADKGATALVQDISFSIAPGEILGLVGESGCGKSVTAMSILRLLPEPQTRIAQGQVRFEDVNIAALKPAGLRKLRGGRIGMIFQEPMTSLNPSFTIGWQLREALRLHTNLRGSALETRLLEVLTLVGIGAPERRLAQYPHELSGGLRQRIMIAMALSCSPKLLIADEPTTALDVTIQLQILELIGKLRRELGMAVLLITHDLGVISSFADRVAVMYAGRIIETAPADLLFAAPRHPYTAGLLAARPRLAAPREMLTAIAGTVPPPHARPAGCTFAPRCSRVLDKCKIERPELAGETRQVACWNPVP
jgi:oligopeptide/dipeptide ABC transporter ATP-binding protein